MVVLDLSRLFENECKELPFNTSLDLSGVRMDGVSPFSGPVPIKGKASSFAGIVTVEYHIGYTLGLPCNRCLESVVQHREIHVSQVAVRSLSGDDGDDFFVLPDGRLDLGEAAYADIILDMPSKILCREDCRGLCPECGANLNHEPCRCARAAVDHRLRPLLDLLD